MSSPQILMALILLVLNGVITVTAILTFTRGLATKDDISRIETKLESLNQNFIEHRKGHP